jgi:hypothetical protein
VTRTAHSGRAPRPSHGTKDEEPRMTLEYLLVQFREDRLVKANDAAVGVTNHMILLPPNDYEITLDGAGFNPPKRVVELYGTSVVRPMVIAFT